MSSLTCAPLWLSDLQQRWVAGGSVATNLDEVASNGVVHVIDRVLYAPYGDLTSTLALSPLLTNITSLLARDETLSGYLSGKS